MLTLSRELIENIDQLRINGKGRETPVADAPTCIEIIWALPGKAAKEFRRVNKELLISQSLFDFLLPPQKKKMQTEP